MMRFCPQKIYLPCRVATGWLLLVCCIVFFLSGCIEPVEPPVIVSIPPPQPTPTLPVIKPPVGAGLYPPEWVPPSLLERKWSAIIIHHSATAYGSMAVFDKWHKEGNGWDGIGYDFVVGNGTYSGDGQVEVTYRWRQQRTGAHSGGTPGNWANEKGIGICLVGDFNRTIPTEKEMQSLVRLVKFLQTRYKIPASRIYGHGSVPGGHVTDCPGKNFSLTRLKTML
jgi:N-acetylmuramoyl-L-alanine amidase